MRKRKTSNGLSVNAIAGTAVVMLGIDQTDAARAGCLGFAIRRERHDTGELEWLHDMKSFEATEDDGGDGDGFRSNRHLFQSYQWADYAARPDTEYTFKVIPLYGDPVNLVEGPSVSVKIRTEAAIGAPHSVFFNRGAAASQAYVRRFNKSIRMIPRTDRATMLLTNGFREACMNRCKTSWLEQWTTHFPCVERS